MLRVLEIKQYDVINGPGVRCSIWLAGCSNHCKGCWSPQTWNPNQGDVYQDCKRKIDKITDNPNIDGVSILGGDPFYWVFQNAKEETDELLQLLDICKVNAKNVWVWSGYTFEQIYDKCPEALRYIDVLVDGPFQEDEKDLNLYWRGSANQRVIDVQQSLLNKEICLMSYQSKQ